MLRTGKRDKLHGDKTHGEFPMPKRHYRVRNWKDYNKSLVNRGSLTFWFDEKSIEQWQAHSPNNKRGRPFIYADIAIECMLTLRAFFHLPLRATQGFINSLVQCLQLAIKVPDYTTLCKRQKQLAIQLPCTYSSSAEPLHIVVDSTGLKVYGEGEWKVRQHGRAKHRTWRKLQVALDVKTQEIVCAALTTNDCHDKEMLSALVEAIDEPIAKLGGDGGYESHHNYEYLAKRQIEAIIPPRKDACIKQHGHCNAIPLTRDEIIRAIRKLGRKGWKEARDYHQRSLVETAMFQLKTLFGDKLQSRCFENQATEAFIKCRALNLMTQLGMPESYAIN